MKEFDELVLVCAQNRLVKGRKDKTTNSCNKRAHLRDETIKDDIQVEELVMLVNGEPLIPLLDAKVINAGGKNHYKEVWVNLRKKGH